jgi:diguanylate cyclase (GGDEF)-like protein/PAS domain S-box-containing protein
MASTLLDASLLSILLFPIFYFLVFRPLLQSITQREKAEDEARKALEELHHQKFALDQHAIVGVADVHGTILYANDQFCAISGYTREELLGQDHRILKSGTHPKEYFVEMYRTIAAGTVWHGEFCNRAKDGHLYWVDTTIVPYTDEYGKLTEYVSMRTDITERKKMEEQVRQMAFFDTLTKLPNRRLLTDRLTQAIAVSKRTKSYGALLFLDLDNFKPLNDTHGHVVGDLLLIEAADRLKNCVREMDTVARFGGDEFVVMLNELDVDKTAATSQARLVAKKIQAALSAPYLLQVGHDGEPGLTFEHRCTASIGVAMFMNHESDQEDILKWADAAMYEAKEAGRNQIRFYGS